MSCVKELEIQDLAVITSTADEAELKCEIFAWRRKGRGRHNSFKGKRDCEDD